MTAQTSFVTIVPGAPTPCVVWDGDGNAIGYYDGSTLSPDYASLPWWVMEVETSLTLRNAANQGGYPVLDRDARLLWPNARIEMRFGARGNAETLTGHFVSVSEHAVATVETDKPVSWIARLPGGIEVSQTPKTRHSLSTTEFKREGALKGWVRLASSVGNHDLGFDQHYIRLIDDPRAVSRPARPQERRRLIGR